MVIKHEALLLATNGFAKTNIVGKGGFGGVFRGKLTCGSGCKSPQ